MSKVGIKVDVVGVDGAGKTTLCTALEAVMRGCGYRVFQTCEPQRLTAITTAINDRLEHHAHTLTEPHRSRLLTLLFTADRMDQWYRRGGILDTLGEGINVVSDRGPLCTLAYQGTDIGLRASPMARYVALLNRDFPPPTLTIYLAVTPLLAEVRLRGRGERVSAEHLSLVGRAHVGYEWLMPNESARSAMSTPVNGLSYRYVRLNGMPDKESVLGEAVAVLRRLLPSHFSRLWAPDVPFPAEAPR